eukprot:SAG22_NODE_1045_length_5866_cov_1.781516_3_plen_332_part_00
MASASSSSAMLAVATLSVLGCADALANGLGARHLVLPVLIGPGTSYSFIIIQVLSLTRPHTRQRAARVLARPTALTPPRGFSTWNQWPDGGCDGTLTDEYPCMKMQGASGGSVTEAMSRRYMKGMVAAGLNQMNYTYFIIDEPCFIGRDANGELLENKTTWPTGLKAFGAELRSHGMKLGIYTCVGPKTCGGCIASEGHEDQDMQTFADWGVSARHLFRVCARTKRQAAACAVWLTCWRPGGIWFACRPNTSRLTRVRATAPRPPAWRTPRLAARSCGRGSRRRSRRPARIWSTPSSATATPAAAASRGSGRRSTRTAGGQTSTSRTASAR